MSRLPLSTSVASSSTNTDSFQRGLFWESQGLGPFPKHMFFKTAWASGAWVLPAKQCSPVNVWAVSGPPGFPRFLRFHFHQIYWQVRSSTFTAGVTGQGAGEGELSHRKSNPRPFPVYPMRFTVQNGVQGTIAKISQIQYHAPMQLELPRFHPSILMWGIIQITQECYLIVQFYTEIHSEDSTTSYGMEVPFLFYILKWKTEANVQNCKKNDKKNLLSILHCLSFLEM